MPAQAANSKELTYGRATGLQLQAHSVQNKPAEMKRSWPQVTALKATPSIGSADALLTAPACKRRSVGNQGEAHLKVEVVIVCLLAGAVF